MVRCSTALAFAILCGHVIEFRFHAGAGFAAAFCIVALMIGVHCRCWAIWSVLQR